MKSHEMRTVAAGRRQPYPTELIVYLIQTIPPTAVQQDPGETSTVRRWSAKALATARVEPCRTGGDCPVTAKPVKFANQAAA